MQVIEAIRGDLAHAATRLTKRRRRRRVTAGVALAFALLAGAAVAAVTGAPPFHGATDRHLIPQEDPTRPASSVTGTAEAGRWAVTSYVSKGQDDLICTKLSTVSGRPQQTTGCASGDVVAANFLTDGPASFSVTNGPDTAAQQTLLAYGVVDAGAQSVQAIDPAGRRYSAVVSGSVISVPVRPDRNGLSAEGEDLVKRMPSEIRARTFGVVFPVPPGSTDETLRLDVDTPDGTKELTAPLHLGVLKSAAAAASKRHAKHRHRAAR